MANLSLTKQKIIDYLVQNPQTPVVKLVGHFLISKQAIQKHLKELIEMNLIFKSGLPPKVFYSILPVNSQFNVSKIDSDLVKDYIIITPAGQKKTGTEAFEYWCSQRDYDPMQYIDIYKEILEKYSKYYNNHGLINATSKFQDTFKQECQIDKCFYGSFSSIEIFGKTGIYTQMLYAKQSGNKVNMLEFFPQIANQITNLIKHYNIQAVGFVAPTVSRKIQLLKELEKYLKLTLPKVKITKIKNQFLVPQKTLSKSSERKQNADETFVVEYVPQVKNILLIDDFVGSGSSFNSIAKKIKFKHNCTIICFAISGTPNGVINNQNNKFEVINEA